jgi:hypothetical protein
MARIRSSVTWEPGSRVTAHGRLEFAQAMPAPGELGEPIAEAVADDDGRVVLDGFDPLQPVWLCGYPLQSDGVTVIGAFAEASDRVVSELVLARDVEGSE